MVAPKDLSDHVELWWGNPAEWRWSRKARLRVGMAVSEAESLVAKDRERAIDNLQRADLLICPSEYSTRAIRESPIDVPIVVVPFGVDIDAMPYIKRKWALPHKMRFLLAGAAQFRKGTWLGIEAFLRTFWRMSQVHLTVWSSTKTPMLAELQREYGRSKLITFDETHYKDPLEVFLLHHVLLSPHLSEGFGLIVPEAMATGMPVIMSRVSSPAEFFRKEFGWWIEMSEDYAPVDKCLEDTAGFWRLPSLDSLAVAMNDANKFRGIAKARGEKASQYVRGNLSWDQTASGIITKIEEVLNA